MYPFIPGLELSRRFYFESVRPLLDKQFPGLPHAAALIGPGSEVLGFDSEMSMDHNWCPKLIIFLRNQDAHLKEPIKEMLSWHLPHVFLGFPVDSVPIPDEPNTYVMELCTTGPVSHNIFPVILQDFVWQHMAWDINQPLEPADWLTFPSQVLREMTAGAVHYDGVGELTEFRQRLAWYPRDVWLFLLASGWQRISQEEHLMPRAGYAGDELGSALIASRLVRDVMNLCFLMEKQYAPYPKWFGSAFKQLDCARDLLPLLWRVQQEETWQTRQAALGEAYEYLGRMHNHLGITESLPEKVSNFYNRPFKVIRGEVFANAIQQQIIDPEVQRIASRGLIGNVDQISDNTDLRSEVSWYPMLRRLYKPASES